MFTTLENLSLLIQQQVKVIGDTMRQIDQLVYQLYGLTEEEIRIVEGNAPPADESSCGGQVRRLRNRSTLKRSKFAIRKRGSKLFF